MWSEEETDHDEVCALYKQKLQFPNEHEMDNLITHIGMNKENV